MRQAKKEKKKNFYFRISLKLESGKKIPKKQQKNLKTLSDIIFSQNVMRQAKKEKKKNFYFRIPLKLESGKKIPKKQQNKLKKKKKKTFFRHYFQPKRDEIGRERKKKNFTPEFRSYLTPARKF